MKSVEKIIGLLFIGLGLLFTLTNLGFLQISMSLIWPIFLVIPGLLFEYGYYSRKKDPGLLFPGAILTTLGLIFFFHTITHFAYIQFLWPLFILPTGIAFLQFYLHGLNHKVFLILFFMFSALTVFFITFQFFIFHPYLILSLAFIFVGILVILPHNKRNP